MSRIVLILPTATYRAEDFLRAARRLGAEVVVASEQEQALAEAMEDRALTLSLHDPEAAAGEIVALHGRKPIDAVVAVDEEGVLAGALAAERLGLPHNPPEAVARSRDKAGQRRVLTAAGLTQPAFREVPADGDVARAAEEIGFPCVVKATCLSASRGVIRADGPQEAARAADRVRRIVADAGHDPGGKLVCEEYVPGTEVALEGLVREGRLEVLAIFDKPDPLEGPYFEETIYTTPSRLPPEALERIEGTIGDAVEALGLREGPIHAELRMDGERLVVLEVAARSIGGLCSRTLSFGLGMSLEEVVLRHALSRPLGRFPRDREAAGVMMIPIPESGVLERVDGRDEALAVPGIAGLEITATVGQRIRGLPEGDRYLGFLFARAPTPAEAEDALRAAHGRLEIHIVDPADGR